MSRSVHRKRFREANDGQSKWQYDCWKAKDETKGAKKKKNPLCDDGRIIQNFRLPKHIMTKKKNTVVTWTLFANIDIIRRKLVTRIKLWEKLCAETQGLK